MRLRGRDFEERTCDGAHDGAAGRSPIGMGHADTHRCSGWSPGLACSWYLPCRRIRRQAIAPSICSRMVAASAAVRLPAGWEDGLLVVERAERPRVWGASW